MKEREIVSFMWRGAVCVVYSRHITLAGYKMMMAIVPQPLRIRITNEIIRQQHEPLLADIKEKMKKADMYIKAGAICSQAESPRRVRKSKQKTPRAHYGPTATGHQPKNR